MSVDSDDEIDMDELVKFSINVEKELHNKILKKHTKLYNNCSTCNISMEIHNDNSLICISCGFVKHIITENNEYEKSSIGNYNTNDSYHLPVKCVGTGSCSYQKTFRNFASNYKNIHINFIVKKLLNKCMQDKRINIPKSIILKVIDKYTDMKDEKIMNNYRATVLDGLLGSIIFYECLNNNIAVKHQEIADWFDISITKITKTDKILKELNINNKYKIDDDNQKKVVISSFCKRIDLNDEHIDLLFEVFTYMEENNIGNKTSRLSTKAASLIYVLSLSNSDLNITTDDINANFDVSLSTMKNFYESLHACYDEINPIFQKYNLNLATKASLKTKKPKNQRKPRKKKTTLDEVVDNVLKNNEDTSTNTSTNTSTKKQRKPRKKKTSTVEN